MSPGMVTVMNKMLAREERKMKEKDGDEQWLVDEEPMAMAMSDDDALTKGQSDDHGDAFLQKRWAAKWLET